MKVMFACVCDHASADSIGKLTVSGIFDRINSASYPATHSRMVLVFRLMLDYDDNDRDHSLRFRMVDEDGNELMSADMGIEHQRILPGQFATANQIIQMDNLTIARAGRYKFEFLSDGNPAFEVPFDAVQL